MHILYVSLDAFDLLYFGDAVKKSRASFARPFVLRSTFLLYIYLCMCGGTCAIIVTHAMHL